MTLPATCRWRDPDLAARVGAVARERGNQSLARLLADLAQSEELAKLPAFAPDHLAATARVFLDIILLPLMLRALLGDDIVAAKPRLGKTTVSPQVIT